MSKKKIVSVDESFAIRNEVLKTALLIEFLTSSLIAKLLGIKNFQESKVLGHKGGALSFSQKVNLLIEIGAIPKKEKSKFQAFMEIRNQFMHTLAANTYEKCVEFIPGREKYLQKNYPQKSSLSKEAQLRKAITMLRNDITAITSEIINKVAEKTLADFDVKLSEISNKAFDYAIKKVGDSFEESFNKAISEGETIKSKRLKGLGKRFSKLVYGAYKKKFEELADEAKDVLLKEIKTSAS